MFVELHEIHIYLSYWFIICNKYLFSSFTENKMILKENVSEYQPKLIKKIMLTFCWILALFVTGAEVREINLAGKSLLWWGVCFWCSWCLLTT